MREIKEWYMYYSKDSSYSDIVVKVWINYVLIIWSKYWSLYKMNIDRFKEWIIKEINLDDIDMSLEEEIDWIDNL